MKGNPSKITEILHLGGASKFSWRAIFFLVLALFAFNLKIVGQELTVTPFASGEKLTYSAYYNWHFIWIKSGLVHFNVHSVHENGTKFYELNATGKTLKAYDFIYKVRNNFHSRCCGNLSPLVFNREVKHGRNYSIHYYNVDHQKDKIFTKIKKKKGQFLVDSINYEPGSFDMLATAYYARTLDYENYEHGQMVPFKLIDENKVERLHFRYLGEEAVKTRNRMSFRCHKISILLMKGDFFPGGEYMNVWISADKNRVPIMVETNILVGSVKAVLKSFEGLKAPLTSVMN